MTAVMISLFPVPDAHPQLFHLPPCLFRLEGPNDDDAEAKALLLAEAEEVRVMEPVMRFMDLARTLLEVCSGFFVCTWRRVAETTRAELMLTDSALKA